MPLAPISIHERSRLLSQRARLETEIFCARLNGDRPALLALCEQRDRCLARLDCGSWAPYGAGALQPALSR